MEPFMDFNIPDYKQHRALEISKRIVLSCCVGHYQEFECKVAHLENNMVWLTGQIECSLELRKIRDMSLRVTRDTTCLRISL